MNYYGTIRSDAAYTEKAICSILCVSQGSFRDYYKKGLQFFQLNRKHPRLITGTEFLRFVEKHARPDPDESDEKKQ